MDNEQNSHQPIEAVDGQSLLNQLDKLAPLSPQSAEELVQAGYTEIYSYREYEANGAANTEHLKLALERIRSASPITGDYDIVRAKLDQAKANKFEHDRLRALLKKATAQRAEWDKNH